MLLVINYSLPSVIRFHPSIRPSFKSYSVTISRFKGFTTKNTKGKEDRIRKSEVRINPSEFILTSEF
jgi:hypothetical protein